MGRSIPSPLSQNSGNPNAWNAASGGASSHGSPVDILSPAIASSTKLSPARDMNFNPPPKKI